MTNDELDELERLEKAASPGPWAGYPVGMLRGADWVVRNTPDDDGRIMTHPDADLIAAARNALPKLIAEVRQLRAALAKIHAAFDAIETEPRCWIPRK